MKNHLALFFAVTTCVALHAQKDSTLISSIGYWNNLMHAECGGTFSVDENTYPNDLSKSGLFYIGIAKEEVGCNQGLLGPYPDKINEEVAKKMAKYYPSKFQNFPNSYRSKSKNYFIKEGYKYRLLIHSGFFDEYTSNGTVRRQKFAVAIQDITTGRIYRYEDWHYHNVYIKKFVKILEDNKL